jgi:hypothetical protein
MEENGGQPGQRALKRYVREMGKQEESAVTWHNPRTCFVHFLDRVFFSFLFFPFVPCGGAGSCAEYKKVRADIKKRTAEAQRWQKKAKKIRSGMAGSTNQQMNAGNTTVGDRQLNAANQELLRAADAAQIDLNSRLALLQVKYYFLFI